MTIQGELDFSASGAFGLEGSMAQSMFAMKGEDGKFYAKANYDFGPAGTSQSFYMGQIDSNNATFYQTDEAAERIQLNSLALPGVGSVSNWAFGQQGGITAIGSPYFWIPMGSLNPGLSPQRGANIWLRYKVNSGGTVVFDGYTGGTCSSGSVNSGTVGMLVYFTIGPGNVSQIVVGANQFSSGSLSGSLWTVMETGAGNLFGTNSFRIHLVRIPLTGNDWDQTDGSFDQYLTLLPYPESLTLLSQGTVRLYTNKVSVMEEPGGGGLIRLFMYLGYYQAINLGYSNATLLTLLVNPTAHTSDAAWTDVSSIFGVPFPDTLYNYAGALTTNDRNDYTSPTVIGNDVFFMRGFDDALNIARRRMFTISGANLTQIEEGAVVDDTYTTVPPSGLSNQIEFIEGFRDDDIFYTMGRFATQYVYGNMGPYPNVTPEPSSGIPYYIERMDNRIWPTIEDAWCVDSGLSLPQPAPTASLAITSATGDGSIRSYNVINGGSGYTAPIGQVFDLTGPGSGATVTLSVSSGVIVTATPVVIGSGYKMPAQLTVLDTTGVGAVIQPIVTNYTTLSTNTSSFTSSDVGSIVRVGGGKLEVITVSSTTSVIANVITTITKTVPNDPYNTPIDADAGDWTMTVPTTTVSGLAHLVGLSVVALADGGVVTGLTVDEDGKVTLPVEASQVVVGLPFVAQLQTMYLDLGGGPTVQTRRKDVTQAVVRVENSLAPEVGINQPDAAAQPNQAEIPWGVYPTTALTQIRYRTPNMPAGQPQPMFSGDLDITNLFSNWDQRGQIAVQQSDPIPLSVTALTVWVKVGDSTGQ